MFDKIVFVLIIFFLIISNFVGLKCYNDPFLEAISLFYSNHFWFSDDFSGTRDFNLF